jgi:pimeloyl-ACP methyl ester carboxylesterase
MIRVSRRLLLALLSGALLAAPVAGITAVEELPLKSIDIGGGVRLHYVEQGSGPPLILVHGSLSDYTYWTDQIAPLAKRYRVVAYSRRYNFPNHNPARPGYSAVTDAEDAAHLIEALRLGKVYVVGHSYGAFTALFLAARHPRMIRAVVVAEPPAVSLLRHLSGPDASQGRAMFDDIQARMVAPMKAAFAAGDTERGVAAFIDYVFADPGAWDRFSASGKAETLRDAHEWEVMMTGGTLFPDLPPESVRRISVPVLVMSGAKSYPFLGKIDQALIQMLPDSRRIVFPDAGHQMWLQRPVEARGEAEAFFAQHGGPQR